jgi:hypothetical protein
MVYLYSDIKGNEPSLIQTKISPCGKECGRYKPLAESLK